MSEFWKLNIGDWNVGTDDLTLEQEAAYLRVINAIRLYDQPIKHNLRVLSGLWRCNERKAKRLLADLVSAGKLTVQDGLIINERAVEDASNLRQLRMERASAGRRGGIESGKARRKALENNDTGEASASTREEKRREEVRGGGDDAGAREPDPPRSLDSEIGPIKKSEPSQLERIVTAMGGQPGGFTPGGAFLGTMNDKRALDQWTGDLGLTEDEISEVIGLVMAKKRDGPPNSFNYFNSAMQRRAGEKQAAAKPLNPIEPSEVENRHGINGNHHTAAGGRRSSSAETELQRAVRAAAEGTSGEGFNTG
jgi:uncharacterized protein YdaU (DUF1376 family)